MNRPEALLTATAALLICLSSARTAHATCGDYLLDRNGMHHGDASVDRSVPSEFPLDPARSPAPCDGPSCGQSSDKGLTASTPIEQNRRSQSDFASLRSSDVQRPPVVEYLQIESLKPTRFIPQPLLRPPEATS